MNLTGLLRILFRWKGIGLVMFGGLLVLGTLSALIWPLSYESQVMLERKPMKVTPQAQRLEDETFDVDRLTSESQWAVTVLKSRAMMERWMDAIGLTAATPHEKEKILARLSRSLKVQPVSYTDLFSVKVRAPSPEEAARRAGLLVSQFTAWDVEQNRQEAQALATMLQTRVTDVNRELSNEWTKLKDQKSNQALSLSGSSSARQMEQDIAAREKLYDLLTLELDQAQRMVRSDQRSRTQVLAAPSVPGDPVLPISKRLILALSVSMLGAMAFVFLVEWQDTTIRRSSDIVREITPDSIIAIPSLSQSDWANRSAAYLSPLSDAIVKRVQAKGSTVVQFASPADGDGKTTLSTSLAKMLAADLKVCLVHRDRAASASEETPQIITTGDYHSIKVPMSEPLSQHLFAAAKDYNLILIDSDSMTESPQGSCLLPEADLACVLVSAGRTSRHFFRAFRNQIQRFPDQRLVFILNRYEDPLPRWLQPR